MAQDLVVSSSALVTQQPRIRLFSRIIGRERWRVDILEGNPRLAAAVELLLQTEKGVIEARANPVTGSVLIRYDPRAITEPVEILLRRTLKTSPLSRDEFLLLRPKRAAESSHGHWLTAKTAFCLLHMMLLGALCPLGVASAALLWFGQRTKHSEHPPAVALDRSESAVTN